MPLEKVAARAQAPLLAAGNKHGSYRGASLSSAVFNLATSIIGAGIMSIPATLKVLGVVPAVVLIFFIAFICDVSSEFLLRYTSSGSATTYAGVMYESFGRWGSVLLQLSIIITNMGCLVIYLIIAGDVLSGTQAEGSVHLGVLQEWFGVNWWNSRAFVLLFIVLFVMLPLLLLRRVDSLRFSSAISVLFAVVFVVTCSAMAIFSLIIGAVETRRWFPEFTGDISFFDLFTAVPVIVTAFTFHFNVHPISAEIEKKSDMSKAVKISLVLCAFIYAAIGFFGYLLFGDSTMTDVLSNFDKSSDSPLGLLLNDIVRLSYAIHLILVFPLVNFSLRINVDGLLFPKSTPSSIDDTRFFTLTGSLLGFAYFASIAIPSIWSFFQFLGSTSAVCIAFIFPAAIVLRDVHHISTPRDRLLAAVMIVLAVIASAIAITTNIINLFKRK